MSSFQPTMAQFCRRVLVLTEAPNSGVSGVQEGRNDTVFKKPKGPTATTPSSSKRASKNSRTPTKSKPEETDDIYDEELAGGDSFFADSAIDSRPTSKFVDSDSESEGETVEDQKVRQSKAYLAKLARGTAQDSDESGSENGMDMDELTSRVAEDAVRFKWYYPKPTLMILFYPILQFTDHPPLFYSFNLLEKCHTEQRPILYVIEAPIPSYTLCALEEAVY